MRDKRDNVSQFTCPQCSSHHFGSYSEDGGHTLNRLCNGYLGRGRRCNFSWPARDDQKYGLHAPLTLQFEGQERAVVNTAILYANHEEQK